MLVSSPRAQSGPADSTMGGLLPIEQFISILRIFLNKFRDKKVAVYYFKTLLNVRVTTHCMFAQIFRCLIYSRISFSQSQRNNTGIILRTL